jgi:chromosome segregation protein
MKVTEVESDDIVTTLTSKSDQIKKLQDDYAENYSKNQNIKKESIKRKERISIIDQEFESWQNLLTNSEKMVNELNTRKNKLVEKLNDLEKQPQSQAEKKGKISENLRISENEKNENEVLVEKIDNNIAIFSTKTSFSFFSFSEILKFSEIFPFFSA